MSENDDPIDFLHGFFGHIRAFTAWAAHAAGCRPLTAQKWRG
jgi:hypothetical protein